MGILSKMKIAILGSVDGEMYVVKEASLYKEEAKKEEE